MSRYFWLLALVVGAALLLHQIPRFSPPPVPDALSARRVQVLWRLEVRGGRLIPDLLSAPRSARAEIRICNRDSMPHSLRLLGYEDVLAEMNVPAGDSLVRSLILDRPADDLAMELDGKPAARVAVMGSHLLGDHR